jgi:hypothetical protein
MKPSTYSHKGLSDKNNVVTYSHLLLCLACSPGKEDIDEAKQRGADQARGLEGNL